MGCASRRQTGQMDSDARGGVARRQSGSRPEYRCRVWRSTPMAGSWLCAGTECTMPARLHCGLWRHPNRVFADAGLDRPRHPSGRGDEQPRLCQYRADHTLLRRRPPRGRLHQGASGRPGSARDAYRPGRIAPEKSRSAFVSVLPIRCFRMRPATSEPARRVPVPYAHRLDL